MLKNLDNIMHLRFNFDACPMHSPFGFVHLTHQNLSARALFCLNSLAKVNMQLLIYKYRLLWAHLKSIFPGPRPKEKYSRPKFRSLPIKIYSSVLRWLYCLTICGCNFVFNDLLQQTLISKNGPWFTFPFIHIWWHHNDVIRFYGKSYFFIIPCFW